MEMDRYEVEDEPLRKEWHLRLGILGGTFDPIHFGHLRVAEEMGEEMELEKVYLIPGALPPHKDRKPITPFYHRLAMTQMAAQDSPVLETLDLEGRRQGFSYTIETLKKIHQIHRSNLELFFIIGMDAFQEIKTWKDYKKLFDYANFVVIKRPGFPSQELESFLFSLGVGFKRESDSRNFITPSGNTLIYQETILMDISSTNIREMVATGKSIRFLVPEPVRSYMMEKGLYRIYGDA
ncbi:MAG: nicotinate-nucleotide adenylyltransferase [Deltaproteobacteria bacterium]|nr:nicotinate-nucleotide adenylyltransferase [Deltaproteobacteria bacterium]